MLGLKRVASFDELLNKDKTFDLTRVKNLARSAIEFRNSFYNLPPEDNEVVDENFDARLHQFHVNVEAAGAQHEQQQERQQEQARQVFAQNMPRQQPIHHSIPAESFANRMKARQEMFKQQGHWTYRRDMNELRQQARQASERQQELDKKRRQPQQFNIASPTPSPPPSPPPSPRGAPDKLQQKYDQRLQNRTARNPAVARPKTAPAPNERLAQARQSAEQIARKRERPPRENLRRTRRRTNFGAMQ